MHPRQHQHLNGRPRKRRLHRKLLKTAGRILQTAVILATVAVAGTAVLAMVAQTRPLPVGSWVARVAGDRLQNRLAGQGLAAVIDQFDLSLRPGLVPVVEARGLRLYRRGESVPLLALAEADLVIDGSALLRGRFQPKALRLAGMKATLAATGGGVSLGAERATILQAVRRPGEALAQLRSILDQPNFASLQELGISGIDLRVEDQVNGWAWHNPDGDLRIGRQGEALTLQLQLAGPGEAPAQGALSLGVTADMAAGTGRLRFAARGVNPAQLLPGEGSGLVLPPDPVADLPLSILLAADLRADGTLAPLRGRVSFGDGHVQLGAERRATVRSGGADLLFDPQRDILEVDNLRLDSDLLAFSGAARVIPGWTPAGAVKSAALQFSATGLSLDLPGVLAKPVEGARLETALRYDLAQRRIELAPSWLVADGAAVQVSGGAELPDPLRCITPGAPSRTLLPDCWRMQFDARAGELDLDAVRALWPPAVAQAPRKWALENVHAGTVRDARLSLRLDRRGPPESALTFRFGGGEVTAVPGIPEISAAEGFFSLQQHRLAVALDHAEMAAPEGGTVQITGGRIAKSDTTVKSTPLEVSGHAEAPAPAALSLLAVPALTGGKLGALPVGPGDVGGGVALDIALSVPMGPDRASRKLDYRVTGQITEAATAALLPGRQLESPRLDLSLDRSKVTVAGPATLDGFPAEVTWSRAMGPGADGSDIAFSAPLTRGLLEEIGVPLSGSKVSGTGRVEGTVALRQGRPPQLALDGDLAGMAVSVPALGWSKPAGRAGSVDLSGHLGPAPAFDRLRLRAPGLSLDGRLSMRAGGGLSELAFSRAQLGGWFDAAVTLRPRQGGRPALSLSGGTLDLRGLPKGGGGSGGGKDGPGPVALRDMTVRVTDTLALANVAGGIDLAAGNAGKLEGRVNGGAPVDIRLSAAQPGPSIRIRSSDAGRVAQDAGLFRRAGGGVLDLRLDPTGQAGSYRGRLGIDGITITEAPVAARVLSAISVVGIAEQMIKGGIHFGRVDAQFLLTPERMVVSQASATGPSLGLSLDGEVDLKRKAMDIQGVLSPFYFLNRVGAGMTRPGEGLLGITFGVSGPFARPRVRANPLSLLAPGGMREIFRNPAPEIGGEG
ncbi:AsmA-like C-terminal region-containing protein [Mangrovicoccus sp. HB161399]|uniref:YhdP family protein n=1 Tax=Mangrovicoccus sp. HB161399 TaxID=2720392 RepID=UPI00155270E7|nr:AsmA-like C-terminal region-containing protein [Mangrovicoccus sp. HB161399]